MQELLEIGITENDFQLIDKAIKRISDTNERAQKLDIDHEIQHALGEATAMARAIPDFMTTLQRKFDDRKIQARQENEQLVELQYRMLQLKKLLARFHDTRDPEPKEQVVSIETD